MSTTDSVDKYVQKTSFRWTTQRREAVVLVAANELTDTEIAKHFGISRMTLHNWKTNPDFAAEVGGKIGEIQAGMLKLAIANKYKRLKVLNDLHEKLLTVIEERAAEYAGLDAGTGTGTVVRQIKQVGTGRDAQIVTEYAVDNSTIRTLMALEQQAAQELGQWLDKVQVENLTTTIEIVGVADDAI